MAKGSLYLRIVDKKGQMVVGESIDADHVNEIDIGSWSWSIDDPAVLPKTGRGASGADAKSKSKSDAGSIGESDTKIKPSLLSITKRTDASTVRLIGAMDKGEVFPTATLFVEEEFKESPSPFHLEVAMTDVLVVKLNLDIDAGKAGAEFKESWDLNYKTIKFSYRLRGGPQQGTIELEFDRPREDAATVSKKSAQTAAEEKAAKDKEVAEMAKRLAKQMAQKKN